MTKVCNCCKEEVPLASFSFRKDSGKYRNECNPCRNKKYMLKYKEDPLTRERNRANSRIYNIKKYGISVEDFHRMLDEQKGLCLICESNICPLAEMKDLLKVACIDHCHESGKVRGLLCRACNSGLGHFKDNTSFLGKAIEYLRTHG